MQLNNIEIRNFKSESSVKTCLWNVKIGLLLTVGLLVIAATVLGYMPNLVKIPIGFLVAAPLLLSALAVRSQAISSNYKLLVRYINEDAEALSALSR
jgi:hypothetical protein